MGPNSPAPLTLGAAVREELPAASANQRVCRGSSTSCWEGAPMTAWSWSSPKVVWAMRTSISTFLIALWCLRPETRGLLPVPSFGAYVTVFLTDLNVGRTLRSSADCLFGAAAAVLLAWLISFAHGSNVLLTACALFGQSFLWSYVELPVPSRRLALSTMVMICLTSQRRGLQVFDCAGIVVLVALSSLFAMFANLVPFGHQWAVSDAIVVRKGAGTAVQLLVERSITAFLETDIKRHHIAILQLHEISRVARHNLTRLKARVADVQWEPRCLSLSADPLPELKRDVQLLCKLFDLAETLQRTLIGLPFNECHIAFAKRLQSPLSDVTDLLDALVPPLPSESEGAVSRLEDALRVLQSEYGAARRELLYPEKSTVESAGIVFQTIRWRMEDLLHMNSFLFTLMHLLANCAYGSTQGGPSAPRSSAWIAHVKTLVNALKPSVPCTVNWSDARSALRFAVAICLAASVSLVPAFHTEFQLEIWAPVEVTFLMFKHGGGSLRQSVLRLQGALLGSIAGYLVVLFIGYAYFEVQAAVLAFWSFVSCLFRGSESHGYAAIVSAWTAVIVAAAGVVSEDARDATTPALERMTHTVVGVAALVLTINVVFPVWARDVAQQELISVFGKFEELFDRLYVPWVAKSQEMQSEVTEERAHLISPSASAQDDADVERGDPDAKIAGQDALLHEIVRRIEDFRSLVGEACQEPALWRPAYQADASRRVASLLEQMCGWLRMFNTYIAESPMVLTRTFGDQKPQRWLSENWVSSLQGIHHMVDLVLSRLRNALVDDGLRGKPYCDAILVESAETTLRVELRSFLKRYDWILSGTISESQLRIFAGMQKEQFLRNFDMLFYNSLVFATQGFVEAVLSCSEAMRQLTIVECGAAESSNVANIEALVKRPPFLESLVKADQQRAMSPHGSSPASPSRFAEAGDTSGDPDASQVPQKTELSFTVLGPDRVGVMHDMAKTVFSYGGNIAASRMAQLDGDIAVVTKLVLPVSSAPKVERELKNVLRGLQVCMTTAREDASDAHCFTGEVICVCPEDAPGLLLRLTSVLVELELNLLALEAEVRPKRGGEGFVMRARIGATAPINEELLMKHLDALREEAGPGTVATYTSLTQPAVHESRELGRNVNAEPQTAM